MDIDDLKDIFKMDKGNVNYSNYPEFDSEIEEQIYIVKGIKVDSAFTNYDEAVKYAEKKFHNYYITTLVVDKEI